MKEKTRKRLFLLARMLIALVAITYILVTFDLKKAWAELTNPYPDPFWVAMAMVAFLTFMAFLTLRWYILSRARKHPYSFLYLYRSVLIHMLFNNVLPTTIGGDVYRVMDTGGHEGKGVAFSIVWTDRMVGFIAVFGFGFIASIPYTIMSGYFLYFIIFGGMFAIAITLTLAFLSRRINKWISPWLSKIKIFKYPLGEKIANAFMSITHYRKHKRSLIAAIFTSLGVQLSLVCIWFFMFLALPEKPEEVKEHVQTEQLAINLQTSDDVINGISSAESMAESSLNFQLDTSGYQSDTTSLETLTFRPNFIHFTVTIPAVNTVAMFSVGGWGLREVTFVNLLSTFSEEGELSEKEEKNLKEKYLATALLFDAINLFFGLMGGVFLLFRRTKKSSKE